MWFDGELSHWNPYKSSTWAISQHGNDVSKNVECRYLFLGHGAHSLPSELKNPPVAAVALCSLFKEQRLSCCRLNSSTDFCFHLIKLQLVCLLVGLIYCLNCADDPHKIHLLLHLLWRCQCWIGLSCDAGALHLKLTVGWNCDAGCGNGRKVTAFGGAPVLSPWLSVPLSSHLCHRGVDKTANILIWDQNPNIGTQHWGQSQL